MKRNIQKGFGLPPDQNELLQQHAALPRHEGWEARVIRAALREFFEKHKEEINPPQ